MLSALITLTMDFFPHFIVETVIVLKVLKVNKPKVLKGKNALHRVS